MRKQGRIDQPIPRIFVYKSDLMTNGVSIYVYPLSQVGRRMDGEFQVSYTRTDGIRMDGGYFLVFTGTKPSFLRMTDGGFH